MPSRSFSSSVCLSQPVSPSCTSTTWLDRASSIRILPTANPCKFPANLPVKLCVSAVVPFLLVEKTAKYIAVWITLGDCLLLQLRIHVWPIGRHLPRLGRYHQQVRLLISSDLGERRLRNPSEEGVCYASLQQNTQYNGMSLVTSLNPLL